MSVQSRPITTAPARGFPSGISLAALLIGLVLDAYGIIGLSREHRLGQRFIIGEVP